MIHPNGFVFLSLIVLISCWVVAASLMVEKTNVGKAVFIADITSMCGFGSDGADALLPAFSFVRCCSHRVLFHVSWGVVLEHSPTLCDQLQGLPRT